jgi:hypothetical protein
VGNNPDIAVFFKRKLAGHSFYSALSQKDTTAAVYSR